ncbi:hypothetical protein OCGS_1914 [Oceaniovalibus guishaninsula JLT2003]|uniref:Excalibur calcium-binding domain-containing protein n=1 Tax=Oceaniovalibus guishaninsula JLT2003 TaxID=1231392 RepID=K2H8L8_9RHOB|nr:hypothetical protein [Oceaniovalibus guishaninsula]EKE43933.1 hypothetical protein OCGS_1914 [Oceaniovalibus guishaninsula JLT2003]
MHIHAGCALLVAALGLASCAPSTPARFADTPPPAGVGFGDYGSYEAARVARERDLAGVPVAPFTPVPTVPPGAAPVIGADELARAGLPTAGASAFPAADPIQSAPLAPAVPAAPLAPAAPVVVDVNNPGISDENNFAAVSARETIESDAERIARNREAYQVIQPTALPTRDGPSGPNVVEFALNTSNAVGQRIYSRGGLNQKAKFDRNCAKYPSPDKAQQDFLSRGGPDRDRLGLDPDGDGFACYWDPAPFRAARN